MNISSGPVTEQAYQLCGAIDALPPSDQATTLVVAAGELGEKVNELEDALALLETFLDNNHVIYSSELCLKFLRARKRGEVPWNCIDKHKNWKP